MSFDGFRPAAFDWFAGLEADNSRDWFHAHRAAYDAEVRGPLEELLQELVAGSPHGLAVSKQLLRDVPTWDRQQAFDETQRISAELFRGPDAAEGIAAFRERRPASWVPVSEG